MDELAGQGVVGGLQLLGGEGEGVLAALVVDLALQAAQAADGLAVLQVEVAAVAVGAHAGVALVLGVLDVLGGLGDVAADLVGAGHPLVLHQDGQRPGEHLVVNDLPHGGQGQHAGVALGAGHPVGAAHGHEGDDLVLQDAGIGGGAAGLLGDLGADDVVAAVHAGAKAVGNRVEEAGGALLKDGGGEDNAVGVQHLVQQPVKVVLQHALAAAAAQHALHAGGAAGAVLDVQVLQLDELYLGAHLLGPHQGLDAHTVVAAVAHTAGNTQNFHLYFLLLKSKKFSLPSFPLHITRSLPLCKMPVLYG